MQTKTWIATLAIVFLIPISARANEACRNISPGMPGFESTVASCVTGMLDEIQRLKQERRIPANAVIAFDRSQTDGACPSGWSLFKSAGGRVIVGAGSHENNGISTYASHADGGNSAIGGQEQTFLTENNVPSHNHGLFGDGVNHVTRAPLREDIVSYRSENNGDFAYELLKTPSVSDYGRYRGASSSWGGNGSGIDPIENRPPFVALYYCSKD